MKRHVQFAPGISALLSIVAVGFLGGCSTPEPARRPAATAGPVVQFLVRTNYLGWTNSIVLSNGRVEAIVVPEIGRVMQFRFVGGPDGPFWDNRELQGKSPDATTTNWLNFGGDKSWPAPQADWNDRTSRTWPPPTGFDAVPNEARIDDRAVTLVSPVDPHYGVRVHRRIELDLDLPVMTITTTFEKVSGPPLKVGVWTISQLKSPLAVYVPVPEFTRFHDGYTLLSGQVPPDLRREGEWIVLTRNRKEPHKIGTDANTLIWMDQRQVLRIDSPRVITGADYPDQQSSAEVYTNPDPLAYVELEMLGPLHKMIAGDKISRTSTFTLLPRREADPDLEAARLMAR